MIINLHFTSRKIQAKKYRQQNYTIAEYQYAKESTWKYKITNNNKYMCKKGNC